MRKISLIVNSSLAKRQFLCTPVLDILKNNPKNEIIIFTQPKKILKTTVPGRIKVCSYQNFLWLRKIGISRSMVVFWAYVILGIKKSDIIILTNWIDQELIEILRLARKKNIPTLFIQEGMGNPWENYLTDIYPDKLLVWGDVAKKAYIERGISFDSIEVTGQPRFDWYSKLEKKEVFTKVNNKKTLLYATQPLWKEPKRFNDGENIVKKTFDMILNVCKKLDLQLVCKLHPSDRPDFYARDGVIILEETGSKSENYKKWYCNTGYDPEIDDIKRLGHILLSSDIVVTMFSTVGLEAMILNRPVIFLDIAGYSQKEPVSRALFESAKFFFVDTESKFEEMVKMYLEKPEIYRDLEKKVVYNFAYIQDGKASERVVLAIEGLLFLKTRSVV